MGVGGEEGVGMGVGGGTGSSDDEGRSTVDVRRKRE